MIYVLQEQDEPYRIKIGFSDHVKTRIAAWSATLPQKIKVLKTMPGTIEDERWIHSQLKEYRVEGSREWYYPFPEVLDYLDNDGSLDAAC